LTVRSSWFSIVRSLDADKDDNFAGIGHCHGFGEHISELSRDWQLSLDDDDDDANDDDDDMPLASGVTGS